MKIIYILQYSLEHTESIGIRKKVALQIGAFKSMGHTVYELSMEKYGWILRLDGQKLMYGLCSNKKDMNRDITDRLTGLQIDLAYVRHADMDFFRADFLECLKKVVPKIVMEIPTYPYQDEYTDKTNLEIDQYYCTQKLKQYVDLIVNYNGYKEIYDIPAVSLYNGITAGHYKQKKPSTVVGRDIRLLVVSTLVAWQGIDRIINGMAQYYKKQQKTYNISCHIVGKGPEEKRLRELVGKKHMDKHVKFMGEMAGKDLDVEFDEADIAIGSLGRHRTGLIRMSTIKAAEYCVRGIPFIIAHDEFAFPESFPYILKCCPDDSPVDMQDVISFYQKMQKYQSKEAAMRKFAEDRFDWEKQFRIVLGRPGLF